MIKPQALVLGVVMALVAAGVYFGLNLLPKDSMPSWLRRANVEALKEAAKAPDPNKREVAKTAEATAQPAAPGSETTPGPGAGANAAPAAPPSPPPQQTAQAEPTPPPASTPAPEEKKPEEKPAPPPPAPTAPPKEEKAEAAPPPAEEKPAPAPKPAKKAAAKPAKKTLPPESEPPAGAAAAQEEQGPSEPARKAPPQAESIKQWWPDPSKMPANQLKLVYAGQVKGEKAIALLFSSALDPQTLNKNIQVVDEGGKPAHAAWEVGNNPRMAVMKGLTVGRYTIILNPPVADSQGFMLGTKLEGPVYIQ